MAPGAAPDRSGERGRVARDDGVEIERRAAEQPVADHAADQPRLRPGLGGRRRRARQRL